MANALALGLSALQRLALALEALPVIATLANGAYPWSCTREGTCHRGGRARRPRCGGAQVDIQFGRHGGSRSWFEPFGLNVSNWCSEVDLEVSVENADAFTPRLRLHHKKAEDDRIVRNLDDVPLREGGEIT